MRRTRRGVLAAGGAALTAGCLDFIPGTASTDCEIAPAPPVEEQSAPVAGDPDAAVTVLAFEDFSCPHCKEYHESVVPELRSEYIDPGRVRYERHDFPLPVHPRWSWWVASAARSVQDGVGDDAFYEYVDRCYANQGSYNLELLGELAVEVGAADCPTQSAASEQTYRPVLEADKGRGEELGVEGTPGIFVDGTPVGNDYESISEAIDAAL